MQPSNAELSIAGSCDERLKVSRANLACVNLSHYPIRVPDISGTQAAQELNLLSKSSNMVEFGPDLRTAWHWFQDLLGQFKCAMGCFMATLLVSGVRPSNGFHIRVVSALHQVHPASTTLKRRHLQTVAIQCNHLLITLHSSNILLVVAFWSILVIFSACCHCARVFQDESIMALSAGSKTLYNIQRAVMTDQGFPVTFGTPFWY